jgi:hypothetical protein
MNNYECDDLLSILIDKNDFLFEFMFEFGIVQILILILSLISSKMKYINYVLSNIFGMLYITTSLWYYSILYSYYYDEIFFDSYRFYMRNTSILDPIRLSMYYYLFGEMVVFMLNFILIPLIAIGFGYLLSLLANIVIKISNGNNLY